MRIMEKTKITSKTKTLEEELQELHLTAGTPIEIEYWEAIPNWITYGSEWSFAVEVLGRDRAIVAYPLKKEYSSKIGYYVGREERAIIISEDKVLSPRHHISIRSSSRGIVTIKKLEVKK